MSQVSKENAGTVSESYITDQGEVISSQSTSGDTSKDHNNSEEEVSHIFALDTRMVSIRLLRGVIIHTVQVPKLHKLCKSCVPRGETASEYTSISTGASNGGEARIITFTDDVPCICNSGSSVDHKLRQ